MPRKTKFRPATGFKSRISSFAKQQAQDRRALWKGICARTRQARYELDVIIMGERAAKRAATIKLKSIVEGFKPQKKQPAEQAARPADVPADDEIADVVDD